MAFSSQLLWQSVHFSTSSLLNPTQQAASRPQKPQLLTHLCVSHFHLKASSFYRLSSVKATVDGDVNGAVEKPKPARRSRKKGPTSSSSSSATDSKPKKTRRSKKSQAENGTIEDEPASEIPKELELTKANFEDSDDEIEIELPLLSSLSPTTSKPKKTRRSKKSQAEDETIEDEELEINIFEDELTEADFENYEDDIDSYEDPPLVCCFGAVQKEFSPTVRVSEIRQHPHMYSQWKMLHWKPPEFARAPGGPPSNVAIAHVRLGGRAAVMGKLGMDMLGGELLVMLNKEKVQTRGIRLDPDVKTACTEMKIKFEDGKMKMEMVKEPAEDSLLSSELNLSVLKEARMLHFTSEVLTSPSMQSSLFKAISFFKKFGELVFFDLNLPLPLWRSRDETREVIKRAWNEANIIEVSRQELEFLLDEDYYERKKNYKHQYYAEDYDKSKNRRDYHHYTREEISPLWHDGIKFLFVTDGTLRIHYYTPSFDGAIVGTEDVLITPMTCDRTGSGDAVVAAIMRKLTTHPEMFDNQDFLERQLRFCVAAGIIAQWTIGAVRGFPTESAAQNLKEQVYVPSMW